MSTTPACPIRATGIPTVDTDHRRLWEILLMLQQGDQSATVQELAEELQQLTWDHFHREERMFQKLNYPDAANHTTEHHRFLERLNQLVAAIRHGEQPTPSPLERMVAETRNPVGHTPDLARLGPSRQVASLLTDWLIRHTNTTDQQYVAFLAQRGVDPTSLILD